MRGSTIARKISHEYGAHIHEHNKSVGKQTIYCQPFER
jgi:hypothetical protein